MATKPTVATQPPPTENSKGCLRGPKGQKFRVFAHRTVRRWGKVIHRFGKNTNWHGAGPAIHAVGLAKLVWLVLFLAMAGICLWQLSTNISKYIGNPSGTAIELHYSAIDFPAVTVCSQTAAMRSNASQVAGIAIDPTNDSVLFDKLQMFTQSQLFASSLQMTETIKGCLMSESSCDWGDWNTYYDQDNGLCFQYNNKKPSKFSVARVGPLQGLEMVLFDRPEDYFSATTAGGWLISPHVPGDTVFSSVLGYQAAPGWNTKIALTYYYQTRLQSPFGTCTPDSKAATYWYYTTDYNIEACRRSCMQYLIIQACGCADQTTAFPSSASVCNNRTCINNVKSTTTGDMLEKSCSCPPQCAEITYSATISQTAWPQRNDPILQYDTQCSTSGTYSYQINNYADATFEYCYNLYRRRYGRVSVYFDTLYYEALLTSKTYTVFNLLTDVGSNLGLFLGGSFITVGEFLHLLMNLVLVFCRKPPEITADTAEEEIVEEDPDALTPERVAELRAIVKAIHMQRLSNQRGNQDSDESDGYVTEEEEETKPASVEAAHPPTNTTNPAEPEKKLKLQ